VQRDPPVGAPAQRESLEARARGGGGRKVQIENGKCANAEILYGTLRSTLSLQRERERHRRIRYTISVLVHRHMQNSCTRLTSLPTPTLPVHCPQADVPLTRRERVRGYSTYVLLLAGDLLKTRLRLFASPHSNTNTSTVT
jgi:hypothetical protein